MKLLCFLKTLPWSLFKENKKRPRKGAFTLVSVFIFFIFSTLGLSMLYLTQVYMKTSAYRKNTILLEYASENGIKQGFNQLHGLLLERSSPMVLTEEEILELKLDASKGEKGIIEKALGSGLPLSSADSWERMGWESLTDFVFDHLSEEEGYFQVRYVGVTSSRGQLEHFKPVKDTRLDSTLEILAGHIPLPVIPVLVDKKMSLTEKSSFLKENRIEILPSEMISLPAPVAFSEDEIIPEQAVSQLAKALKIKIFHPQDLLASKLRIALGLEPNNEPVPDGVYLIEDDLGLGGIFVQGDVDQMILAIQDNFQVIKFLTEDGFWVLTFSPQERKTIFTTPMETRFYELIPLGMVIVNGSIHSLGGGYVDSAGEIIMNKEEELPCILKGVNLTIISSDEITLSSHLIYQGVKWEEGVPYIKDSTVQLSIFATGKDFFDASETTGQITIAEDAPDEMKIQAALIASGKGIGVLGKGKDIQILGSLQASDLSLSENTISIKYDERFSKAGDLLKHPPRTESPVLYLASFKIIGWRENF
ncbi:MAG: hypothetical protein OEY18_02135 [Candidatus Aminicenantes bacterium]|nr:hypothetical protein [Candidatus Aminicenantes bacterium]